VFEEIGKTVLYFVAIETRQHIYIVHVYLAAADNGALSKRKDKSKSTLKSRTITRKSVAGRKKKCPIKSGRELHPVSDKSSTPSKYATVD